MFASGFLKVYTPHMIHVLNQHDPERVYVHNSFAFRMDNRKSLYFNRGIKQTGSGN